MLTKQQSEITLLPKRNRKSQNIRKFFNTIIVFDHYLYQKKIGEL
jgi:hypothetical protein